MMKRGGQRVPSWGRRGGQRGRSSIPQRTSNRHHDTTANGSPRMEASTCDDRVIHQGTGHTEYRYRGYKLSGKHSKEHGGTDELKNNTAKGFQSDHENAGSQVATFDGFNGTITELQSTYGMVRIGNRHYEFELEQVLFSGDTLLGKPIPLETKDLTTVLRVGDQVSARLEKGLIASVIVLPDEAEKLPGIGQGELKPTNPKKFLPHSTRNINNQENQNNMTEIDATSDTANEVGDRKSPSTNATLGIRNPYMKYGAIGSKTHISNAYDSHVDMKQRTPWRQPRSGRIGSFGDEPGVSRNGNAFMHRNKHGLDPFSFGSLGEALPDHRGSHKRTSPKRTFSHQGYDGRMIERSDKHHIFSERHTQNRHTSPSYQMDLDNDDMKIGQPNGQNRLLDGQSKYFASSGSEAALTPSFAPPTMVGPYQNQGYACNVGMVSLSAATPGMVPGWPSAICSTCLQAAPGCACDVAKMSSYTRESVRLGCEDGVSETDSGIPLSSGLVESRVEPGTAEVAPGLYTSQPAIVQQSIQQPSGFATPWSNVPVWSNNVAHQFASNLINFPYSSANCTRTFTVADPMYSSAPVTNVSQTSPVAGNTQFEPNSFAGVSTGYFPSAMVPPVIADNATSSSVMFDGKATSQRQYGVLPSPSYGYGTGPRGW